MSKQKVFISGPISSKLDTYQADFTAAAQLVERAGFIAINPATLPIGMDPADYMRITMAMLDSADMVLLLDGWTESDGAQLEAGYADYIKKPCMDMRNFQGKYLNEPDRKHISRVERIFGAKEDWPKTEPTKAPEPEQQEGYKGFLLIRCPECGEIRGFCSKSCTTETTCRRCGAVTKLEGLIPAYLNCAKCGSRFKYRTNINTQDPVPFRCLECEAQVDLQLNGRGTALVTLDDQRGGVLIMLHISERQNPTGW